MIFPRHGGEGHGAATGIATGAAAATTGTAMADMNMPGMDMGGGDDDHGSGGGGMMAMMMSVFQTNPRTPLYSSGWTPQNAAGYAGTIIFLVLLAVLFRCLLALKARQESRWLDAELNRRYVVVNGRLPMAERASVDSLQKQPRAVLSANGVEEDVVVVKKHTVGARPWRLSVDPVRAIIDTVIAGVGYLLMLAVMTMNVGYFLAVLGGTFIGSLAVGRFTSGSEH